MTTPNQILPNDFGPIPQHELTVEKAYNYIARAMIQLHQCCDGASSNDAMGFAGMHTHQGKNLGAQMMDGLQLTLKDVEFCRNALPYYRNTQLSWMDMELFDDCLAVLFKEAAKTERLLEKFENILQGKSDNWFIAIAAGVEAEDWPQKNRQFIKSLVEQCMLKDRLSQKQWHWVRKLTTELLLTQARSDFALAEEFVKNERSNT